MDTRQALLDAGGQEFAQHGFRDATLREICAQAGANLASVRYHFGDKAGLYSAVIDYACHCATDRYSLDAALDPSSEPEQRLQAFVHSLIYRLLDPERPAWHAALMVREFSEPTHALPAVINDIIRPLFDTLESIVATLLGDDADQQRVALNVRSIIGQCTFYRQGRFVMARLYGEAIIGVEQVDVIAGHIVAFSLAALRAQSSSSGQGRAK